MNSNLAAKYTRPRKADTITAGTPLAEVRQQLTTPDSSTPHLSANDAAPFSETPLPVISRVESINPAEAFAADLQQRICRRAYELAEQRGFAPGDEVADWLRAEREVLAAPDALVHPQS